MKWQEARTNEGTQPEAKRQVSKDTGQENRPFTLKLCPLPFRGPESEHSIPDLPVPFEIFEDKI